MKLPLGARGTDVPARATGSGLKPGRSALYPSGVRTMHRGSGSRSV